MPGLLSRSTRFLRFTRIFCLWSSCFLLLATASPTTAQTIPPTPAAANGISYSGVFFIVAGGPEPLFYLQTDTGQNLELKIDPNLLSSAGGAWPLNRQRVQLSGQALGPSRQTANSTVITVTTIQPEKTSGPGPSIPQPSAIIGSRPFANILCKFSDYLSEPQTPTYFQNLMSSSYPGMDHYFREASYNTIDLTGTVVAGWFILPHPKIYYVNPSLDFGKAAADCTAQADSTVNFSTIQGINLMFSTDLDGYAWGGSWYLTLDGVSKSWPMTWMPPWGYGNQAVMAHEMGHAFGMPHSGNSVGTTYQNVWDVMSDTWTNCALLTVAPYGCIGQQEIAYHKDLPGWIPTARYYTYSGGVGRITLKRLAQPTAGNYLIAKIPLPGKNSSLYYVTVEYRYRVGYDLKTPQSGVVIHSIDKTRTNPAWVIDPDGGSSQNAYFTAGQSYTDAANDFMVKVLSVSPDGADILIGNGLVVTKGSDDSLFGGLSYAMTKSKTGDTIWLVPQGTNTVTVNQTVSLKAGVSLKGSCPNGPGVILQATGAPDNADGVVLSGVGGDLEGLKILGFSGRQLVASPGKHTLRCVVAVS